MEKLKWKIYNLIRDDDENDWASNIFDGVIIILIIINVIMVIVDTFDGLPMWYGPFSSVVETVSVVIFSIEYILRVWTSTYIYPRKNPLLARMRYMVSFMAIVDLLSILPFYVPFFIPVDLRVLRALRMVRLMRLFKANRYSNAMKTIVIVIRKSASQLVSSFIVIFILMVITSVLMCDAEKAAQPEKFNNAISGLWWAVATFTTVGYGDIYPITAVGKVLSGIIAILGIGLVAVPTGIISAGFMEQISEEKSEVPESQKQYCPYCGKKLK